MLCLTSEKPSEREFFVPAGTDLGVKLLKSTDTRPIKATKLALDVIRANEITIENSKTGKVNSVVAILKVFGNKFTDSWSANIIG